MTLREAQSLFAHNVALLIIWCKENNYEVTFGEAWRTPEQQAIYVRQGKSKTKNSNHLKRLAIDLNVFQNGKLLTTSAQIAPLGKYWNSLATKNRWGGDWNKNGSTKDETFIDAPHFEFQF